MPRASWNNHVIAEAPESEIERVEANAYFPLSAVKRECLRPSQAHTYCPWKGEASYFDVVVDGKVNADAAWYYAAPYAAAEKIRGRVAFWHGVQVENADG